MYQIFGCQERSVHIRPPSGEVIATNFATDVGRNVTLIGECRQSNKMTRILRSQCYHMSSQGLSDLGRRTEQRNQISEAAYSTGDFLKPTGRDRVVTCAGELLMQAWELNNGRKTEGGVYRKGQRQKTMKVKYEKNFCRQIKELATTNRGNYFDISLM